MKKRGRVAARFGVLGAEQPGPLLPPSPAGAEGDAELELAVVLADDEGDVGVADEVEGGLEVGLEEVEDGARGPLVSRGEGLEPGGGGGEGELAAGEDEVGELVEEARGLGEAAEEVGGVDDVVLSGGGQGVADGEADALRMAAVRKLDLVLGGSPAVPVEAVADGGAARDALGGLDEGPREVAGGEPRRRCG